ncbi:hypothetical protein FRC17_001501 [Serendipita sp. 399]|nr:hypothetical protein FRC17_001501 [Serendipita sp. 399]
MIRNAPSNTLPTSAPLPVMRFEPSNLPLTHIVSLRSKLSQIIESLNALTYSIDADGRPGMSSWPDILSKYNNLLTQSHTLINTLSGAHIPQPPRKAGEARRERINPFETIALHPLILSTPAAAAAPTSSGQTVNGITVPSTSATSTGFDETHHGMLENLLRTDPHSEVIKRWDETVRRFVERRKGGTQVEPQDVIKEMTAMKEGHDARIERAMRVVEDLREKWDWKMRVTLDDPLPGGDDDDDDDDDDDEDLFGDDEDMDEPSVPPAWLGTPKQSNAIPVPSQPDEVMRTPSQSMEYSQNQSQAGMDVSSMNSSQPPPPTQHTTTQDTEMIFDSDDSDDDDDLEDVMKS